MGEVITLVSGRPIVLHVAWFAAVLRFSRSVVESRPTWELARLEAEHRLRAQIKALMDKTGYVPVGDIQIEVTEDVAHWDTELRMRQRGMESDNPIWISIRDAVSEDQAWLRSEGQVDVD